MTKRHRNLIETIVSDETMQEAYRLTSRGKRLTPQRLAFKEFDALNLERLAAAMHDGSYVQGEPTRFRIHDPKPRLIAALPFADRVAQQAIGLVLEPIFDRALLPRAYACRKGKGTHAGVRALQGDLRRLGREGEVYFLKTDFAAYFASIDRSVLWDLIAAKVSCGGTLRLIEAIVPRIGTGLPIGSLTSQIFANFYTGATLDRLLQQELKERYWYRYMDDLVVLGHSPVRLRAVKQAVENFSRDRLGLKFSKWQIAPASRGINFLGYRIWASHKLLRRQSVVRAKRRIATYRDRDDRDGLKQFIAAWGGHAAHADSGNLLRSLQIAEAAHA